MNEILKLIYQGVLDGSVPATKEGIQKALDQGLSPEDILNGGLISAMGEVGRLFEIGEYYVPEMLISARAMQNGLAILKPRLLEAKVQSKGKVAIGTVKGDLHDIGKNLVAMMLEGAGFEILDLGVDVSAEKFVEAARSGDVDIIAISALLTTTMSNMKNTINALSEAGLRQNVKVIIGGAPLTDSYANDIGADGYAPDASRAVKLASALLEG